jgi:NAD(P)-dependent dehydrogenase (short-subunit alcohol dehydrogenase family)
MTGAEMAVGPARHSWEARLRIEETTALVTGANRGIGAAFVERLVQRGARRVYAGARNLAALDGLIAGHTSIRADVFAEIAFGHLGTTMSRMLEAPEAAPDPIVADYLKHQDAGR